MKKILEVLLIAMLLLIPAGVFASPLFTDDMTMHYSTNNAASPGVWNSWATVYWSDEYGQAFCTENADLIQGTSSYDFYAINDSLAGDDLSLEYIGWLKEATWYANEWLTGGADRGDAQVAIWYTLGVSSSTPTTQANALMSAFDAAGDQDAYISDWLWAVSPAGVPIEIGVAGQNFLVQHPVPEPATMILLGTGLVGLAGLGRKKFFKK